MRKLSHCQPHTSSTFQKLKPVCQNLGSDIEEFAAEIGLFYFATNSMRQLQFHSITRLFVFSRPITKR